MIKLFYATQNFGKQVNMIERLKDLPVELIFPVNKIDINESGNTEVENAIIKAKAYADHVDLPILAADSGMYFEDSEIKSPKLLVKRMNGQALNNEELVEYYKNLAKTNNGKIKAYFKTGIALMVNDNIYTTEIFEEPFYLMENSSQTNNKKLFDCISYSIKQNKYFSEFNNFNFKKEDKKFSEELIVFLGKYLNI